jgi:hypothetical protein
MLLSNPVPTLPRLPLSSCLGGVRTEYSCQRGHENTVPTMYAPTIVGRENEEKQNRYLLLVCCSPGFAETL